MPWERYAHGVRKREPNDPMAMATMRATTMKATRVASGRGLAPSKRAAAASALAAALFLASFCSLGEAQGPIQTDFPYEDLWGQRRGTPGDLGARREWPKLDQWVDQDLGDGLVDDQDENESENAVGSREATDQVARVTELVEDFAPVQPPQMRGDIRPQNALLGASNSQTIRLMWIKWMLYTGLVEFNFPGLAGRGR
mmetsp:Transcript_10947/g.28123  ORF Transcript_10947/g.28123 Transcript_10947/m.28123 type:complete len:198 (-) Transcript_10947:75-668(-)